MILKLKLILICLVLGIINIIAQEPTVGIIQNSDAALNGYTLIAPSGSRMTYLVDNCGNQVNSWESNYPPGIVAYLLPNSNLLRTCRVPGTFNGGGSGGRIEMFDWDGNLIWGYDHASTLYHQHHDIAYMPNGNILIIAWELITYDQATAAGRVSDFLGNAGIWSEKITEVIPVGEDEVEVVWEWRLWDHIIQDVDSTLENYGVIADHPELINLNINNDVNTIDWIHLNAVNYNETLDQIALSSRHLSEILIIDHSTSTEEAASHEGGNAGQGGDILYRYGNPQNYDRGTGEDKVLFGQHDVNWIPAGFEDEGKLMIFNNGIARPSGTYSSVDVIDPPINLDGTYAIEEGEAFEPSSLSWTYQSPIDFYSSNVSGASRLENGNTLICEGREGRFLEVNYEGEIVWEYISPISGPVVLEQFVEPNNNAVFRVYRYGLDYPAFEDIDIVIGEPIELNPINEDCEIYMDTIVSSLKQAVTSVFSLSPNPFENDLTIQSNTQSSFIMNIHTITGVLISSQQIPANTFSVNVPLANLPAACYIVEFIEQNGLKHTQKLIKR